MKIIIIGDGKVGYSLAENLSRENNDVTIIDKDAEALRKASENLDVMCIKGNGISTKTLIEAGVKESHLLIAATTSDEMNMLCCLTAKKLGVDHAIARIRDPEYANELSLLKADMGLDMVINPEQAAADEIARLLKFPPAINVEVFARGRVEMVEIQVTKDMSITGLHLRDICTKISSSILIGAVLRENEVIIPNGELKIEENDTIYIIGQHSEVLRFCKKIGIYIQKVKNAMIIGGGRISYYLAKYLDEADIKVKIVEIERERCVELAELLPHALIICGDGSDDTFLYSENLKDMDAFISITGWDEDNLVSALLAKQSGVPKVVAKINRINHFSIVKNMGIDNVVCPKLITTNHILRYVRGMKNALGNPVHTLYRIIEDQAEALEFTADSSTQFLDVPLKTLQMAEDTLVAALVRGDQIIIPHGEDVIQLGDRVILIAKNREITDLNDIIIHRGTSNEL